MQTSGGHSHTLAWISRDPARDSARTDHTITAPIPPSYGRAPDLDDLLEQVRQGDRAAFEAFYTEFSPVLFGAVLLILRNHAHAEEVVQEVFLEAWQKVARFERGRGRAAGWMLTMARRRAIDRVRSVQADADRDLRLGIRDFPHPYDDVAETVEISYDSARVRDAMGVLSIVQRQAIELAYFRGFTHTEIAARLETPSGTIKTRIRDGLITLRGQLIGATSEFDLAS